MHTINFDQYGSLAEFRAAVMAAISSGQMSIVVSDSEVLFTAVSPDMTKEMIAKRVASRLAEQPDILADLKKRLEEEAPESWDD